MGGLFFFLFLALFPTSSPPILQPCPHSPSPFGEISLTFFTILQPPIIEPGLILVVVGSCSMDGTGVTHIHLLGQVGLVHFLVTGHTTGSTHLFRTTARNKPWFQSVVYRSFLFGFLFFSSFLSGTKNTTHFLASSNKLGPGPPS